MNSKNEKVKNDNFVSTVDQKANTAIFEPIIHIAD